MAGAARRSPRAGRRVATRATGDDAEREVSAAGLGALALAARLVAFLAASSLPAGFQVRRRLVRTPAVAREDGAGAGVV